MRYGLLALSIAMLTSGGLAAQSALAISRSTGVVLASEPRARIDHGGSYGSLPFTAARSQSMHLAVR